MTAYLYRMPSGIAGAVSRQQDLTIEPGIIDSTNLFPAYGLAGKYSGNKFVPLASGDALGVISGFYVRPYPTTSNPDLVQQTGGGMNTVCDILKRGYLSVNIGGDASSVGKGGTVYIRVAAATVPSPLGSVLAAADGANTVALTNAYFTGAGDASGNTEIAYNL